MSVHVKHEAPPAELRTYYDTWGSYGQHSFKSFAVIKGSEIYDVPAAVKAGMVKVKSIDDRHSRKNYHFSRVYELSGVDAVVLLCCSASSAKHEASATLVTQRDDVSIEEMYDENATGIYVAGFKLKCGGKVYDFRVKCFRGRFRV